MEQVPPYLYYLTQKVLIKIKDEWFEDIVESTSSGPMSNCMKFRFIGTVMDATKIEFVLDTNVNRTRLFIQGETINSGEK